MRISLLSSARRPFLRNDSSIFYQFPRVGQRKYLPVHWTARAQCKLEVYEYLYCSVRERERERECEYIMGNRLHMCAHVSARALVLTASTSAMHCEKVGVNGFLELREQAPSLRTAARCDCAGANQARMPMHCCRVLTPTMCCHCWQTCPVVHITRL